MAPNVFHMDTPQTQADRLTGTIREALARSGVSRRELSARTGIPLTTLQRRLVSPGTGLQLTEATAIASAIGTSLSELAAEAAI